MENLLAIIREEDAQHYLLKQFEDSLPKGTELVFGERVENAWKLPTGDYGPLELKKELPDHFDVHQYHTKIYRYTTGDLERIYTIASKGKIISFNNRPMTFEKDELQ
jgi:hypothetical protein